MISPGELIQLVSPQGKKYLLTVEAGKELHTHHGKIDISEVLEKDFGDEIKTHLGKIYHILKPTLYDLIKNIERKTQIIYPKDIGYILVRLGVGPGSKVVEAGCGSGSLTMSFAYMVGETGKVYSFDRREEFVSLCRKNLTKVGLESRVVLEVRDISEGFGLKGMDCGFLDVREPWLYVEQFSETVKNGCVVGFLLPTTNQVTTLLEALEKGPFIDIEVVEIMLRRYKPVYERFRPEDRMVAHTGFLIFARVKNK